MITNTDMDWDDVPWLSMEWEEVEGEQAVEGEDVPGDEDKALFSSHMQRKEEEKKCRTQQQTGRY